MLLIYATYWCRFAAKKVEIRIFPKQVGLRLWGIKSLTTHDEVSPKEVAYSIVNVRWLEIR